MVNYTQVSTGETLARKQVREVLQAHKGTMARMAAQLGVTRTAVWLVLKGKSKSRRILCACVGEAQRLLEEGQRLGEEAHVPSQSPAGSDLGGAEAQRPGEEGREVRACPNCGEAGGAPEIIRGEGWSEEVCSQCVGRRTQGGEMQPAAGAGDTEPPAGGKEVCPF